MLELALSLANSEADRLDQAEAMVRGYCGWHIAPSRGGSSETFDAIAGNVLLLKSLHVTAVASVTENGTAVDPADYSWTEAGVLTRRCWSWATGPIVVTYTHGHPDVPSEVAGVVRAVAQRAFDNPGSRPRAQAGPFADSYSQVGFNQAPALALLDAEKEILDRYKLPPRP